MKMKMIFTVQRTTLAVEKEPEKNQGQITFSFKPLRLFTLLRRSCSLSCLSLSFEKKIVLYRKLNIYMAFRCHLNFHLAKILDFYCVTWLTPL